MILSSKLSIPKAYLITFLKWGLFGLLMGVLGGLLGAGFHHALHFVTHLRGEHLWLIFLLPLGGLLTVLAQDPRPSYQDDPERIYGMKFNEYEIKFFVKGSNSVTIIIGHKTYFYIFFLQAFNKASCTIICFRLIISYKSVVYVKKCTGYSLFFKEIIFYMMYTFSFVCRFKYFHKTSNK